MISLSKMLDRPIAYDGRKFDVSLLWVIVLMTTFSLVMIYSTSIVHVASDRGSQFSFVSRQAMFILLTVTMCLSLFLLKMSFWRRIVLFHFVVSGLLLLLVSFVGREINGAMCWIHTGPSNLQPTKSSKLVTVLYLSSLFMRREEMLHDLDSLGWSSLFTGTGDLVRSPFKSEAWVRVKERSRKFKILILPTMSVAVGLVLVTGQPDFGSFVMIVVITMGVLFLADFPWKHFVVSVVTIASGMGLLALAAPYCMARVATFLDPWSDSLGEGCQLTHSLMTIVRGGWSDEGLGVNLEKRFYLPEAHMDFISAVIDEEFGFLGTLVLVFYYGRLAWRVFSIGRQARDSGLTFNVYIANGIGIWTDIQSFFNIGVNIGILSTKGLTSPLMSYDGSVVFIMLVCVTLLLRTDYENRQKVRGYSAE